MWHPSPLLPSFPLLPSLLFIIDEQLNPIVLLPARLGLQRISPPTQNSFIAALKSKHFLIAASLSPSERPASLLHSFKYE